MPTQVQQLSFQLELPTSEYSPASLALLSVDDIYTRADETLIRKLSEDRRLERKPSNIHVAELGDYVCMWANTAPDNDLAAWNDGKRIFCEEQRRCYIRSKSGDGRRIRATSVIGI